MSHSQFDTPIDVPIDPGGGQLGVNEVFEVTGPLVTDDDREGDNATISIFVQILQTQTQTVAIGQNVMQGVGLTRWTCPVTLQSGVFRAGPAIGIASTSELYSNPVEHYYYHWTKNLMFR